VLGLLQGGDERLGEPFPGYQMTVFEQGAEHNQGRIGPAVGPIPVGHGRSDICRRKHSYLSTNEYKPATDNKANEKINEGTER
jgi:hypothetical protein